MFYRRPLDSLLYFLLLSLSLCLQIPWLLSSYSQRKKKKEKRKPCMPTPSPPPPPFFFVITKEQIHIKHTQGAEAVIAVSTVLLWVAGGDKISHGAIYIFFWITSNLSRGQVEAGHIPEKRYFSYNKHDVVVFFNHSCLCLLQHVVFWAKGEVRLLHSSSISIDNFSHIQIEVETFLILKKNKKTKKHSLFLSLSVPSQRGWSTVLWASRNGIL